MTLWVFGYGSLLWNPGFDVAEMRPARLHGYARSFCMRSIHHRGTVEEPGLVLALDRQIGTACDGLALRAQNGQEAQVLEYLRDRELVSSAYLEKQLDIEFSDGSAGSAVVYVIDEEHDQYCGGLPLTEQAQIMSTAIGGRGPNSEYLYNTVKALSDMNIPDPDLEWLAAQVRALGG